MTKKSFLSRIALLGCIGYLPASGTIASLCMIPLLCLIHYMSVPLVAQGVLIVIFSVASFFIIRTILPFFVDNDPSEIVLDECVGMMIATYALPVSWLTFFLAFMLFRLLDISKFFGVSSFERLPGAWGVLGDDIAAACITNIILRFIVPLACQ